jgi:hypothetical protein
VTAANGAPASPAISDSATFVTFRTRPVRSPGLSSLRRSTERLCLPSLDLAYLASQSPCASDCAEPLATSMSLAPALFFVARSIFATLSSPRLLTWFCSLCRLLRRQHFQKDLLRTSDTFRRAFFFAMSVTSEWPQETRWALLLPHGCSTVWIALCTAIFEEYLNKRIQCS